MTDREFDLRFAGLAEVPPPPALAARTLASVAAERVRAPARGYHPVGAWRWSLLVAALALVVLNVWTAGPAPDAPVSGLIPKGSGESASHLDLRAAVKHGESVERLVSGARYAVGDTVLFRVTTSIAATATLTRNGVTLWTGAIPAGESDLPVGYTLEAGEPAAQFDLTTAAGAVAGVSVAAVTP